MKKKPCGVDCKSKARVKQSTSYVGPQLLLRTQAVVIVPVTGADQSTRSNICEKVFDQCPLHMSRPLPSWSKAFQQPHRAEPEL